MVKAAKKKISPRNIRSEKELIRIGRDHIDAGEFWILTDSYRVTIAEQKTGSTAKAIVTVPRKKFDKLVDWYMREQILRAGHQ